MTGPPVHPKLGPLVGKAIIAPVFNITFVSEIPGARLQKESAERASREKK